MSSLLQTITYHHNIRQRKKKYSLPLVKHVFARKCMRFCIPDILNKTSNMITDKIKTHSRKGFTVYIKLFLINKYDPICSTPHISYCLKCWGFNQERIFKLQKKAMRIICSSGYLSHSEPLFIKLNVLKIDGMFTHQVLNFRYDLINKNLPAYCNNMSSLLQTITYHHNIKQRKKYSLPLTVSKRCICSEMYAFLYT